MKFALTFIRPEYETPILIPGNTLSELSDRIDKTIERRPHDVCISAIGEDTNQDELKEIASMLLMKGHFLLQNKYCPRVDIFANDKSNCVLDHLQFYVSSTHQNLLDIIFNAFLGGDKFNTMIKRTDRFQYAYFDPQTKHDWIYNVGCIVKDHFNRKLEYKKEIKGAK